MDSDFSSKTQIEHLRCQISAASVNSTHMACITNHRLDPLYSTVHPYLTDKRPVSRVDAGMSQQMVFQGEALLTFRALIRPEIEDNREKPY